ncbi:MAG TPA: cation-transporting P-type ATPase [Planctomycetota bacterium]|nr:cation-transporting P-type ATPase [Planctomycetota bacterium]
MTETQTPTLAQRHAWHTLSIDDVAGILHADLEQGLSTHQVKRRHAHFGPNKLLAARKASAVAILLAQFKSLMVLLLAVAAGVGFATRQPGEGASIAVVILLNAAIGFVVEYKANRAMEALQKLGIQDTVAIRNGRRSQVNAVELVPGDLVEFEAGDSVTVDCRLAEASGLRVQEAALTGESLPVNKSTPPIDDPDRELAERTNMLYKGTTVVSGSAKAIVVTTGMTTEVGRIALLVKQAREEETPLEVGLRKLSRSLIILCLGVAALVTILGIASGRDVTRMIMTGLALAVAAVPEGLPVVATIGLAVGMRRMARRNALIRRLPAVETLGSANVICTDKTGTLTENEMTAVRYELVDGPIHVTGTGFEPKGEFRKDGRAIDPAANEPLRLALICGMLCSNSSLARNPETGEWTVTGDPTEGALVVAAVKAGLDQDELREQYDELRETPFSPEKAMMATQHRGPDGRVYTFVKGAAQRVFDACTAVHTPSGPRPVLDDVRRHFDQAQEELADDALRVLALAYKVTDTPEEPYRGLTLLALAGLYDPPREEVAEAIKRFNDAHIRTVMITGDHPLTAKAVGRTLGIIGDDGEMISGRELAEMPTEALAERADTVNVYARITPEDKVKIVRALQKKGHVVAMLGDGVNDAAALKTANIGVAMGIGGTDLAKETSDIVLLDDRFVTVAAAIEEGRLVLANIKKFIHYLFSCNLSEILTVFLGSITNLPLPLLPLQILWLNLVTDVFPALSLAFEPPERELMKRPPRPATEDIFSARIKRAVVGHGLLITTATLGAFLWGLKSASGTPQEVNMTAQTVCFMTIALSQLFHAWTSRKESLPIMRPGEVFSNPYMIGAAVLTVGLQMVAIYVRPLGRVLHTVPLTLEQLAAVFFFSLGPLMLAQALRWTVYLRRKR